MIVISPSMKMNMKKEPDPPSWKNLVRKTGIALYKKRKSGDYSPPNASDFHHCASYLNLYRRIRQFFEDCGWKDLFFSGPDKLLQFIFHSFFVLLPDSLKVKFVSLLFTKSLRYQMLRNFEYCLFLCFLFLTALLSTCPYIWYIIPHVLRFWHKI